MAPAAAPTTELGAPQASTGFAGPVLDEREANRDLTFPQSAQTYAAMMNDAQIEGLYRGATMPIRAYRWWLDPNGAPPEMVQRISADYGLPIGEDGVMNRRRSQGRFRFDDHLEDALRAIGYGFFPFEQVFEVVDGGLHIRKLAPRPPRSVTQVRPARDGGLDFIRVPSLTSATGRGVMGIQAGMRGGVQLPVNRLVMYAWDREGANWVGRSMLRSSYRPWKLKDRVMRVGAINIERAGGVPYIEAHEGATKPEMDALHQLASAFRVGESAGAALPHGATLKFAQAAGGDAAVNFIRLQNEEMSRAWLMMFMQSGQSSSGHGSTQQVGQQIDYFAEVQKAIAGWFADIFNVHQIEDDVEYNEGASAQYAPLVRFTANGDGLDALAGQMDNAQVAGALPADSPIAAVVCREAGPGRHARLATTERRLAAAAQPPADRSQTDFASLQATFTQAVEALTAAWEPVQVTVLDDLVAQVAAATTLATVVSITAPAVTGAVLLDALAGVLGHGAATVADSIEAQGATMAAPDLTAATQMVSDAADATAVLLAADLTSTVTSRAVALWGPAADPAEVARQVRETADSLEGAAAAYELAGLASRAQNEGRFTALEATPPGVRLYASALNDVNRCGPCGSEDDTEFSSMAEARLDFPTGGYVGCEGRNRCRCTVVAVLSETPGQAA